MPRRLGRPPRRAVRGRRGGAGAPTRAGSHARALRHLDQEKARVRAGGAAAVGRYALDMVVAAADADDA